MVVTLTTKKPQTKQDKTKEKTKTNPKPLPFECSLNGRANKISPVSKLFTYKGRKTSARESDLGAEYESTSTFL